MIADGRDYYLVPADGTQTLEASHSLHPQLSRTRLLNKPVPVSFGMKTLREHLEEALPEFSWTVEPHRTGGNTRTVSAIDASLTEMSLTLIQSRDGRVLLDVTVYLLQSLVTEGGASPTSLETRYPVRQLRDALDRCGCTLALF